MYESFKLLCAMICDIEGILNLVEENKVVLQLLVIRIKDRGNWKQCRLVFCCMVLRAQRFSTRKLEMWVFTFSCSVSWNIFNPVHGIAFFLSN